MDRNPEVIGRMVHHLVGLCLLLSVFHCFSVFDFPIFIILSSLVLNTNTHTKISMTTTVLPREIWSKVLNHVNPTTLCMTVRRVNKMLKEVAEQTLREKHVKRTKIFMDMGRAYLTSMNDDDEEGGGQHYFELNFGFLRFDTNHPEFVIFIDKARQKQRRLKKKKLTNFEKAYNKATLEDWKDRMSSYEQDFSKPPWCIIVDHTINDTELPQYTVNYEKGEIRFNWMKMFECFCREYAYVLKAEDRHFVILTVFHNL